MFVFAFPTSSAFPEGLDFPKNSYQLLKTSTNKKKKEISVMRVTDIVKQKLTDALSPTHLDIVDESYKHAGHAGAHPDGESHFSVTVVSRIFEGKNRIERQRLVYQALSEEMKHRIHALSLETLTPDEVN